MHLASPHGIRDVETEAQREKSTRRIIKDHTPTRNGGPRHDLLIEARDGAKHFIYIISCNNHKNLIN